MNWIQHLRRNEELFIYLFFVEGEMFLFFNYSLFTILLSLTGEKQYEQREGWLFSS